MQTSKIHAACIVVPSRLPTHSDSLMLQSSTCFLPVCQLSFIVHFTLVSVRNLNLPCSLDGCFLRDIQVDGECYISKTFCIKAFPTLTIE